MTAALILVHETEDACRERLAAKGFAAQSAMEISSYLAQSTDLAGEFGAIEAACAARGIGFRPVALDDAAAVLGQADPAATLVWTLTDGIAYYRGSAAPAIARLCGLATFGSDDALFALCQDKFRSGAVLRAAGLPAPAAGLARDGRFLVEPPASATGWFVKPNRLGSKIGIWGDSRCTTQGEALDLSRRIFAAYRDDAVVQPYLPGRNARASFLAVEPGAGVEALGIAFVESGGDFQTMEDSLALYGETGEAARAEDRYAEPILRPVETDLPGAAQTVRTIAAKMMECLGLSDVFSLDLRIEQDGTVHLIEFEVCPGLPCFDFRDYVRSHWGMSLAEAMARAAEARLRG